MSKLKRKENIMKIQDEMLEKYLVYYEDALAHIFMVLIVLSPQIWQKVVFGIALAYTVFCLLLRFRRVRKIEANKPRPQLKPPITKVPATDKNMYSACMYMRHDFGLLDDKEKELMIREGKMWAIALSKVIEDEINDKKDL